jgi:predicted MFS family arabinose efflux permease
MRKSLMISILILLIINGSLGLAAYSCIATPSEFKTKKHPEEQVSKPAIFLAFLLAGTCGVGITYQYYFIEYYVREIMILKVPDQQVIYSPFWIALLFTLLPAAQITKNLKTVKTIQISLLGIALSVSLLYTFPSSSYFILFFHQITFAISFGLFLSPALRFIYRLLHGYNSYFYMNFIFGLGYSCFTLISSYLAGLKFLSIPIQGASLIALLMTACLWTDRHYGLSQKNIKYKHVTL